MADDGDVAAFAFHVSLAQGDDVLAFGYLALGVIQHLAFDEYHGVVVPDGAFEQPLGIGRCRGHNHLEAGNVTVPALERLGVL
jgi:hypothetical protein